MIVNLNVHELTTAAKELKAGDEILLSGTIYTARDAAHKMLFAQINCGEKLPIEICGGVIYYCGPTPAKDGMAIGSCGPTTSSRMDKFAPYLYDMGLCATIGKGPRSIEVIEAIKRNGALYLCAIGGAGALYAKSVIECREIAYPELGTESIKMLKIDKMPLYVGIASDGKSLL